MMRRNKNEERGAYELKRKHQLEADEMKSKMDEMNEEIDYFKSKIDKLEVENNQLRHGKGDNKKMKELENELEFLKA
jgi:FtsZ-binding cell division protein ZapB